MASIFTKILKGELPSYKITEDEHCFSILALDQVNLGHVLVIPKVEIDSFMDVPEPHYSAVFKNAKIISQAIRTATQAPRVAAIIAGFEVNHFHLHLIPAWSLGDVSFSKAQRRLPNEMLEIQKKIVSILNS
jgi:histidine triad (HIT) family protein